MTNPTQHFYDALAEDYHLIFQDWEASLRRQGKILGGLLGAPQPLCTPQSEIVAHNRAARASSFKGYVWQTRREWIMR